METLILREGGLAFVAPSVKERAIDADSVAVRFVEQLEAGDFDMVVCMTGVGLTFLRDMLAPGIPAERLGAALSRTTIVSRGPKPVPVLRSLGVPVQLIIPEPNTWKEIVDAIALRPERRIVIQEYGRPNVEMNNALEAMGAQVTPVAVYRWEMPDDLKPLEEAVNRLARGDADVVLFTSTIQLDHLLATANRLGLGDRVRQALADEVAIGSIGPVMTSSLLAAGYPADIVPRHPKMWALVKAAAELASGVLASKNRRSQDVS